MEISRANAAARSLGTELERRDGNEEVMVEA